MVCSMKSARFSFAHKMKSWMPRCAAGLQLLSPEESAGNNDRHVSIAPSCYLHHLQPQSRYLTFPSYDAQRLSLELGPC